MSLQTAERVGVLPGEYPLQVIYDDTAAGNKSVWCWPFSFGGKSDPQPQQSMPQTVPALPQPQPQPEMVPSVPERLPPNPNEVQLRQ